ncbi:RrF2 family transcriptional regulator [Microbacterium lacusdiani]
MRISARADYAVRAVVALAQARLDGLIRAETIAADEEIPTAFLESILTQLRRAGLIESRRGAGGGFRLRRPAEEVTVADVVRAVDGPLVYVRDVRPSEMEYPQAGGRAMVELWVALRASVRNVLETTSIADLAEGRLPSVVRALVDDPSAWEQSSPFGD